MKKVVFMMFMLLAVATSTQAQLTLKVPQWDKFVKINSESAIMYKAASSTSQKLMCQGEAPWIELSWNREAGAAIYHPERGTVLPVISETSEWYCLYFPHYYPLTGALYDSWAVYVMKRFCNEVRPTSDITPRDCGYEVEQVSGNKGYLIGSYFIGSPSRAPFTRVGHKVNNFVVMGGYDVLEFCTGQGMEMDFNIGTVTEARLERKLRTLSTATEYDIYIKFPGISGGDQTALKFSIDGNYSHEVRTYTFPQNTSSNRTTPSRPLQGMGAPVVIDDDGTGMKASERGDEGERVVRAQETGRSSARTSEQDDEVIVYDVVEQMPQYPGGNAALMQYLSSNIHYPVVAEENGIQGIVQCQCVIEKNGSVSNVSIVRSVEPSLDREAARVLRAMPNWIPGRQNGVTVRVKYTIPVTFRLQ